MASKKEFEAYKKEQKLLLDSKKITYNLYMDRITKFMKGENASTNNYKTLEQQNRMEKNTRLRLENRKNTYKNPKETRQRLKDLKALYDAAANSSGRVRTNPDIARLILLILVDNGYDISFEDKATGKMRRGYDAIDGKIGDATTDAYNAYMAVLEGADKSTYEDDYRAANGGKAPVYGQVAGRTPEEVRAYTNMYYDYFKRYPKAYASLAEGNRELIGYALPYMNDEVMRLLSQNVLEGYQSPEDNASINVNKLARKGLLGSRGDEMLLEAEKINVREAIDRGGLNTLHLATLPLRSGQLAMGMAANALFGDNPWEEDGLQYVERYNPVTGAVENVLVPKAGTTFADAANVENEVGRMVVNTLTDPFFWLSMAPTVKTAASNFKSTLKNGSGYFRGYPEPAANNVMVPHNNADIVVPGGRINNLVMRELESLGRAVRVLNGTTSTAARGGTRATTRGSGAVRGNTRGTGWQQTWGNLPSLTVGSTSTSATWDLLPGEMPSIPELEPIPLNMPFIAPPPMPAPSYKGPSNYTYTMPLGTYAWQYSELPVGNDFIIFNGRAGGEQLLRNASADTHNYWRARNPLYGTGRRWDGDYLSGK